MRTLLLAAMFALPTFVLADEPQKTADPGTVKKPTAQKVEGRWQVVYMEMNGKKLADKEFGDVNIANNVLTCKHEGHEKSYRLEFGPRHMVQATCISGDKSAAAKPAAEDAQVKPDVKDVPKSPPALQVHHGVYIASQEFLCFSMNEGAHHRRLEGKTAPKEGAVREDGERQPEAKQPGTEDAGRANTAYGTSFVLVLRRADAAAPAPTR